MGAVHHLICDEPWFSLIREKKKRVEGRKNTPKHQKIQAGDVIHFENKVGESFDAVVTEVMHYPDLISYLEGEGLKKALPGVKTLEEAVAIYLQWSQLEEIEKWGFLGLRLFVK